MAQRSSRRPALLLPSRRTPRLADLAVTLALSAATSALVARCASREFAPALVLASALAPGVVLPAALCIAHRASRAATTRLAWLAGSSLTAAAMAVTSLLGVRALAGPLHTGAPFAGWGATLLVLVPVALVVRRLGRTALGAHADRTLVGLGAACLVVSALAATSPQRPDTNSCLLKCGGDPRDDFTAVEAYVRREERWHLPTRARALPPALGVLGVAAGATVMLASATRIGRRRRFVRDVASGADPRFRLDVRDGVPGVTLLAGEEPDTPYRPKGVLEWTPLGVDIT